MTDDIEKKRRKIKQLRTTNSSLAHEIETLGGGVDLGTARVEHLIIYLVDQGVLSEDQAVDEQLHWETGLRPQLISIRDGLRHRLEQAAARRRHPAGKQIAEQPKVEQSKTEEPKAEKPGLKLILPPGAKK